MSAIRSLPGERWGNRPAPGCGYLKILGAALQADGETRSVVTASSIRRRSAAWTILRDWTFRSKETSVCIVDDTGRIVREVKVASEPDALLAVLRNPVYQLKRIGLEAGP